MSIKNLSIILVFFVMHSAIFAKDYHVAKNGDDRNPGTAEKPFLTIQSAADVALPGDMITVHEGTYREWVNPINGGLNDQQRIVYQAAPGEEVQIKGSEEINSWERVDKNVWKVTLDNDFFGDFNPYREIIRGDWFIEDHGRDHHLGEVYLNGKALYEIDALEKVQDPKPLQGASDQEGSIFQWYTEHDENTTTIYANFHGADPNKELVEINVRQLVFFPIKTGVNYITVRGFRLSQAATQWAPPTAEQLGLIGPHWSKGWIIEDNVISDSKCTGISLGKERSTGHNLWTELKVKHGTQRERDVIFSALKIGWSKENIGSHIVRRNVIRDCEQTAICGHLGAVFSEIYDNHIYNIHVKNQFYGHEIAGIKLHAPIDVVIRDNLIHDTKRALWMDWQAQGTRITRNVMYRNDSEDLFVEVAHGPMIVDNNIMLSDLSIKNAAQGTAFVHNLIGGNVLLRPVLNRFTPYHYPHSTQVAGLMTIQSGDDRFYNNIFAGNGEPDEPVFNGLHGYNDHPLATDDWVTGNSVNDYARHLYPVFMGANLYLNKAQPYDRAKNAVENRTLEPEISIEEQGEDVYLHITTDESFQTVNTDIITTDVLGVAFQSEMPYENKDGSQVQIDYDYFGEKRKGAKPLVGPIKGLEPGKNRVKVW